MSDSATTTEITKTSCDFSPPGPGWPYTPWAMSALRRGDRRQDTATLAPMGNLTAGLDLEKHPDYLESP
jgi:hypothetical protein